MKWLVFISAIVVAQNEISAQIQPQDPDRFLELKREYFEVHDLYDEFLVGLRTRQTHDERFLQAQFISRIGFITSQIKDLEFSVHRQIVERGVQIGNPAAQCIVEAEATLQSLAEEAGNQIMELSDIARADFMRIPNEFVHPFINKHEIIAKSFLSEVLERLSETNAVMNANQIIEELEAQQVLHRERLATINDDVGEESETMNRYMNYTRAQIFPILEYVIMFFRQGTDVIVANLPNCN